MKELGIISKAKPALFCRVQRGLWGSGVWHQTLGLFIPKFQLKAGHCLRPVNDRPFEILGQFILASAQSVAGDGGVEMMQIVIGDIACAPVSYTHLTLPTIA